MYSMYEVIIYALATFGVSALLTDYDGPADIFRRAKNKLKALDCLVCTSVYIALLLFVFIATGNGSWLTPLAVIGLIVIIERLT